jgi:hypothetical protein
LCRTPSGIGRSNSLIDRSQPALGLFQSHEKQDAHQDHETDRRIGAGEIVAFRKVVDELPKSAEIDEKFGADNVDKGKDQPKADSDKDGGQCRRKKYFPKLLRCLEIEAAPDIHENLAGAGNALNGLEDHRRQC